MARTDGSNLRSKEDNERLARQKKKNPTDIQRAKQLAQQYSNKYNFDNTVRVKQQVGNKKWYSGAQPTGRETYAQMYRVADGNRKKFQELEAKYDQERRTIGSPVYNPYAEATNYKAIQGLEELGYDLSSGVTSEWITANLGILNDKRTTTTGYKAAAPTKKSSGGQNAASWFQALVDTEERTQNAETELGNLASEVKYWAERGYSDDAIIKKVRDGFDNKYKTLNGMDEGRLSGNPTILNRAIDYCGDDTLYGMIWAARNGGGTGNYFTDSVKYTLGQGKLYTRDANSEAARDPSDYESYDPYSIGGTMHDANQRYGVNAFDDKWLEAHRDMLNGTEADAKAWRDIYESVETANTATQELAKLDEWVRNRVEMGYSADDICDDLAARFSGEDQYGSSQYPTLAKMERYRALGSYIDLGYAVDFTLPGYQKRVRDMVEERDAAAQAEAEAKAAAKAERANAVSDAVSGAVTAVGEAGRAAWKWLTGDKGALEDVVSAQKSESGEAQVMGVEDIAKNYARQTFGVEITGKLHPHEEAAIRDAIGKANAANMPGATQESIDAANAAAAALQDVFTGIISDPARIVSGDAAAQEQTKAASGNDYRSSIAYRSVLGASDMEQPREGMADMSAETTAATAEAGEAYKPGTADRNSPEAEAYVKMLSGGEWDGNAYVWALNHSTNRAGVEVELIDGIKDIMSGRVRADGAGLAGAWYRQHAAMISGMAYGQSGIAILDNASGQRQSVPVQDERLSAALDANDRAQESGAISADDYVRNLIALGDTYDIINGMSGDAESVYAQFPQLQARVERVQADCEDAISAYMQQEEDANSAMQSQINAMMDRYLTGGDVTDAEAGFIDAIYASDISAVAGSDSGYRDASAYIRNATSAESILNSGMSFTTGNTEIDSQMDYMTLQQTGATVYAQGVYGLASHKLDNAMREAAAYGMSLDEYYAAYPDRARTPEQIIAEAQAEYKAVWSEFGSTINGLYAANDTLEKADADESAAVKSEDSLTFADSVELGVEAAVESTDFTISLRRAFEMLTYGALTSEESKAHMRIAYMNDPAAARGALVEYLGTLPEGSAEYKELKAKLDTYTDIFDIGMTVPIMKNENAISASEQNTQAIQATVEKYGTDADKTAFSISRGVTSSAIHMGTALAAQSLGVGSFASQLIASSGEAIDNAYELNEQTGNLALSLAASSATWVANGAIDHYMQLGYIDNSILSKSKAMLYKRGISDMSLKAPGALSNVAKKALYITATQLAETSVNAAGEGVTESLQQLIENVITNSAKNISGVRSGAILTGEDFKQAGEAGIMGVVSSPILGTMVSAATSGYTGIMAEPFVDVMGNVLSSAEAQLSPDYEGKIINAAVDTEANVRAMESAQADLAAITGSAEYVEATQAEAELSEAGSAAEEALRSLNDAQAEADAAASALADLDAQMNSGEAFTEDMGKRMGELSKRIAELKNVIAQRTEAFRNAQQRLDAAKARSAQADSAMRRLYDSIMEKYRSEARQAVIDELFAGDSDAARVAEEAYLAKTAELTAAQNRLRSAKPDMELYSKGTARGDNAQTVYYSTREEVEALADEVRQLKAEADAAYALTPEAKADAASADAITEAEAAVTAAEAEAKADPLSVRKQAALESARANLEAIRANDELRTVAESAGKRLRSLDGQTRTGGASDWAAITQRVRDANEKAARLKESYAATDTQRTLSRAIEGFKKYSEADLIDKDSPNHAQAVQAYNELLLARADAEVDNRLNALNATEQGTPEFDSALAAYNEAVRDSQDEVARQIGVTGDMVREALKKSSLGAQVLDAVRAKDRAKAARLIKMILDNDTAGAREKLTGMTVRQRVPFQLLADYETGARGEAGVTRAYSEDAGSRLTKNESLQLDVLDALAKQSGFEIVMKDSLSDTQGAVNGVISRGGTIYVGLDAIEHGYLQAGTHEIVHGIKQRDAAAYSELAQTVSEVLAGQGVDLEQLARDRIAQYERMGQTLDMDGAMEEIVAESTAQIWSSEANMRAFADANPGLFKSMADGFMRFWERVKKIAADIARKNGYGESAALLGSDSALQKVYDTFMKVASDKGIAVEGQDASSGQTYAAGDVSQEPASESIQKYSLNLPTIDYAMKYVIRDDDGSKGMIGALRDALVQTADIQAALNKKDTREQYGRPNIHNINGYLAQNMDVWQQLYDLQESLNNSGVKVDFITAPGQAQIVEGVEQAGGFKGLPIEYVASDGRSAKKFKFSAFWRSVPQMILDSMDTATREKLRAPMVKAVEHAYALRAGVSDLVSGETWDAAFPSLREVRAVASEQSRKGIRNKTDFYAQAPMRDAEKTVMALNLNSACPMFTVGNHGCYLDSCYLTQMANGATGTNLFRTAWYTGEILQLSDQVIDDMNRMGGLRVNGVGDTIIDNRAQYEDAIRHAAMRGLKLKIITKQAITAQIIQEMHDSGVDTSLITVQPSLDSFWLPADLDDKYGSGTRGTTGITDTVKKGNLDAAAVAYDAFFGRATKEVDGVLYRKYGFSREQYEQMVADNPDVNIVPRYVVATAQEIAELALNRDNRNVNDGVLIQTLLHGKPPEGCLNDYEGEVVNFGSLRHVVAKDADGNWEFYGERISKDTGEHTRVPSRAHQMVMDYISQHYDKAQQDIIYSNMKRQMCCQSNDFSDACAGCQAVCPGSGHVNTIQAFSSETFDAFLPRVEAPQLPTFSLNTSAYHQSIAEDLADQLIGNEGNAASVASVLADIDSSMWRDHRQSGKTGDTTTADRNPVEILSDLTRSISVGYNPGGSMSDGNQRMPRAVMGFYNERARSITTRTSEASDLATGLHEFGHAVQARLPELRANQQLLDSLSQQVRDAYRPGELDGEAIAEFVCEYIYNRDGAIMMAGEEFVRDFESMIGQDTELYNAVMDASDQTELWNNADIDSKVRAMVKDGQDPRRGRIGGFIERTLRDIETNIADLTAPADMVSREFRKKALYSLHARRRADVMFTKYMIDPQGRRIGESLAERLYNAGVTEESMDAVITFALERHALDRLAQNKPVFDTHEFPESELRARVDEIIRTRPDIVAGADAIVNFWKDFMDAWWVETGMIDADDMAKMREMYPNYVPTFRVMDKNFRDYGGRSARFSIRGAVEGGSSLEVINPINSLVRMTQQVVSTVSQNQLMREFHAEMQRGGLGEIAERVPQDMAVQRTDTSSLEQTLQAINETGSVDPALMDDAFAEMVNLQERWYGTGQNYGANVVSGVDEYGNRFFYRIKPGAEGLYRMLSGEAMSGAGYGNTFKLVRNFKNAFTRVTTSSNPLFAIRNATRDLQSSTNTGTHSLTYVDGMVRFLGALKDVMLQTDGFNDWFSMGGGDHTRLRTGIDINGGDSISRALTKELTSGRRDRKGRFAMRRSVLDRISNVMTLEGFNNAIENANRYVEYKYGKHDLSTPEGRVEAYMASQDVTVNFGTHGASKIIRGLSSIVPFMNATIQGVNKDYNIIKDVITGDEVTRRQALPKLGKTIMNNMLTAAVQYALLRGIFDGEEDDEDYAILNQEMRVGNIIVPIPKAVMEALGNAVGFDKPYIRIPVAQSQIGQMLYAVSLDAMANVADYSPMEVDLWRAAMSIVSDAIPDGTVFQGISDVINNRTWYGGAIDSEYALSKSAINRYDSETAGLFKYMGKALHVSPAKIEYLATQYSGYYGRVLVPFISNDRLDADSGWTLSGGLRNVAYNVLKSITIDPVSTNDLDSSYSAAKDIIGQIVTDGKAGLPMGNVAYSADGYSAYMAAVQLQKEFNEIDKEISARWRDYSDVESSRLGRYEKVSQMRRIRRDLINQRIMDALALYDEYKMEYIDADTLAISLKGALSTYINHPTVD